MTMPRAILDDVDESVASIELAPHINGFHLEPRCRVCRNDQVRKKVNDLLATGASYAYILRTVEQDNAKLRQARAGHHRFDPQPHRPPLPRAERGESRLPRNPGAPGYGKQRRLHQGRGHRDHADCVL